MPRSKPKAKPRSTQALHNHVMSGPQGQSTGDFKVPQFDGGSIDIGQRLEEGREPIAIVDKMPSTEFADELKFNEDPVTVVLTPSQDKNSPKQIYCAVNGKGAEVWDERTKRWLEFKYVPVGRVLTVKRKYLEVLARSRADSFSTREVTPTPMANQDGFALDADTVPVAPMTIRHDPAGAKGQEWFARVMAEY